MSAVRAAPFVLVLALGCASQPRPPVPAPAPVPAAAPVAPAPPPPPPFRLAFGSCNDVRKPQRLWDVIAASEPAVWVFLGDNIYADTEDMTVMRGLYDALQRDPGYARLHAKARVIGTWDDHDYGKNDAGREYPRRAEAQQLLLDFLGEPKDSPRRAQDGVYASYDFGAPPYDVRVILLDTRFNRDPPGTTADVLGATQWAWLERQLHESPAAVHVIGSSIQVIPEDHPFEKWASFPAARERLFALIAEGGARNVVFLSGDRHFAEVSRQSIGVAQVYDVTSSSMNRPWTDFPGETNRHRVGEPYAGANFGWLEIDWAGAPPSLFLQVRGEDGAVRIETRVALESAR